jgi:H+-translocating NAD(P) transhydrogenase subunit beta
VILAAISQDAIKALYIVAFGLFIYGLMGLTGPRTAVRGNRIAAAGMAIAIVATLLDNRIDNWGLIVAGLVIGTAIGIPAALQVRMTAMPQMVALFNGVGGGAIFLIAWSEFRSTGGWADAPTYVPIFELFAAIVGSISFWGSNIAFGKLQEILPGRPITIGRAQSVLNLLLLVCAVTCSVLIVAGSTHSEGVFILGVLVAAAILGNFVVLPIGGADMPVVISLLNAFTGLSAAATGVALSNYALIVAGMIVGASGSILTNLMAQAMNRSIPSIVAGGFGGVVTSGGTADDGVEKTVRSTSAADAAIQMTYANRVVVVPGYGMAVAQAQHAVREMTKLLEAKGIEVAFAIHPVAGRMPGHMNVLLAEANVPYDEVFELEDINSEFAQADVAFVIGANDVTNPAAEEDKTSPIYGMPVLQVWKAGTVMFIKRSLASGYAGIDNPLFYRDNTMMLLGDAKKMTESIVKAL